MNTQWSLSGKKALITGATKGIGKAIAEELLSFGAEVVAVARDAEEIRQTMGTWNRDSVRAYGIRADVSRAADRKKIFDELETKWKQFDILINNVGTNIRKKAVDYTTEEYDHILNTNLHSVFEICRLSYPFLKGSGCVVNISSVGGLTALRTGAVYAMSKAAMVQLTKNLALEWAPDGIRVNAVAPWYINTPLAESVLKNEEYLQSVLGRTPMHRVGRPEEVSAAAVFLCLPAASYITGQCLAVDGGFSIFGF